MTKHHRKPSQYLSEEDMQKSLQELEGQDWGDGNDFPSYVVKTTNALRRKPLADFTAEDMRLMIGQEIGLDYLIPLVLEKLAANPLTAGDYYEGDVLLNVLKIDPNFWQKKPELRQKLEKIVDAINVVPEELRKALKQFRTKRSKS